MSSICLFDGKLLKIQQLCLLGIENNKKKAFDRNAFLIYTVDKNTEWIRFANLLSGGLDDE